LVSARRFRKNLRGFCFLKKNKPAVKAPLILGQMKSKNIETSDLLDEISKGNERAFAELYRRYYSKYHQFLIKFNRHNHGANSDILQEAFLRVWLNRDRLTEIGNFEAWLFKVVSTESLTFMKKEVHQQAKVNRLKAQYDSEAIPSFEQPRYTELNEIKKIVQACIDKMSAKRREIYLLSREDGLSANQIAEKLNISQNTVYNTLTTALKEIRQSLSDHQIHTSLSILLVIGIF